MLVDAGCSMKHIRESLRAFGTDIECIDAILITHEHIDHISKAANVSRKYDIPVYASPLTWESLPFYNDYLPEERHIYDYGMEIGDIAVDFFKLSHDAVQPVGMVFSAEGQRVAVATDTGRITGAMLRMMKDVDGLVLEANHDRRMLLGGPYPAYLKQRILSDHGHLSNEQAGEALCDIIGPHTAHVILAHLSERNNDPDLALSRVRSILLASGIDPSFVSVAPRKAAHELIVLP